jgi:SAM-dependent methyltransferase
LFVSDATQQLSALGRVIDLLEEAGISYWLLGGWAVDFYAGSVTRAHDDLDLAVWLVDLPRIAELLHDDGWRHAPLDDEDGGTGYERGAVRLELTYLVRDGDGRVFTPLRDGRAAWPEEALGNDVGELRGVRSRLIARAALRRGKSSPRDDPEDAVKDRADFLQLSDVTGGGREPGWLEDSYDAYPRVEKEFQAALDESLNPRGPGMLYGLVEEMRLPPRSFVVDVGCGEGKHSLELAKRFDFTVTGIDPVARQIELAKARAALDPVVGRRVRFELGRAEALPIADETVDLIWCRDVLVHVADLDKAYAEFHRVARANGRLLVYQMFAGDRLEPREAEWLWKTTGVVPASLARARTDAAISAAGLRVDGCIDLSTEWGEWNEEQSGKGGRRLLYTSRLLRDPERYIAQFGQTAYEFMLGDCLWHVYGMIGKLNRRVYLLSRPED